MIDLGFYERVIQIKNQKKNKMKKTGIIIACGITLAVWIAIALILGAGAIACVLVSVLIVAVPFAVTSFTATELEISFSADHISLSMIYGGRRRKELFWAEPDDMVLIAPNTKENLAKADEFSPKQRFSALSGDKDENVKEWIAVFKDSKENHYLFTFEAEEGAQKLLKALKPSAMSYR